MQNIRRRRNTGRRGRRNRRRKRGIRKRGRISRRKKRGKKVYCQTLNN